MRKFGYGLAACLLVLLGGCNGSGASNTLAYGLQNAAASDCSITGQNYDILGVMQSWYYWYQYLPNLNPAAYASTQGFLDALRYPPLDRFSFITTQAANQAFYGAGQYVGIGFSQQVVNGDQVRITQVFPGSPAAAAGMARGDYLLAVNGIPVATLLASNQYASAFGPAQPGVEVTLEFQPPGGSAQTVTLAKTVITQPNVTLVQTFSAGGRTVGYFFFQNFINPSFDELQQAFTQLQAAGAQELVVDERYNGGGLLAVAQYLGSLIVGNAYAGRTFATLNYNSQHSDQNQTLAFESVQHALNLNRVIIITTAATASASELVINALKPYIDVVTIGSATFGKPVGENGFDFCGNVLYPMTFKMENAAGYGDYFSGFAPTCPALDDLDHPLGSASEASLAEALYYIANGNCGPVAASAARALSRAAALRPVTPRYGWRNLVNAY